MAWHVDLEPQPDGTLHVWPHDDNVPHELHGAGCVCGPAVERHGTMQLVVHASLDGRELTEV
jgi:hypothetical protein